MSRVDGYRHSILGMVNCPSTFPIMYGNLWERDIPIYRLEEDALNETDFQGKAGDLLIGGGSGESAAFRIAIPEAFYFYTRDDWGMYDTNDEIHRAFWTVTEAFIFGEGYYKLGWIPPSNIEPWLTQHVLQFLLQHYPSDYAHFVGSEPLEEDGSLCRLRNGEERTL